MRKLIDADRFRSLHREREAMVRLEVDNAALVAETESMMLDWMGEAASQVITQGVDRVRNDMESQHIGAFDQLVSSLANYVSIRYSTVAIRQRISEIDAELDSMGS